MFLMCAGSTQACREKGTCGQCVGRYPIAPLLAGWQAYLTLSRLVQNLAVQQRTACSLDSFASALTVSLMCAGASQACREKGTSG